MLLRALHDWEDIWGKLVQSRYKVVSVYCRPSGYFRWLLANYCDRVILGVDKSPSVLFAIEVGYNF